MIRFYVIALYLDYTSKKKIEHFNFSTTVKMNEPGLLTMQRLPSLVTTIVIIPFEISSSSFVGSANSIPLWK